MVLWASPGVLVFFHWPSPRAPSPYTTIILHLVDAQAKFPIGLVAKVNYETHEDGKVSFKLPLDFLGAMSKSSSDVFPAVNKPVIDGRWLTVGYIYDVCYEGGDWLVVTLAPLAGRLSVEEDG